MRSGIKILICFSMVLHGLGAIGAKLPSIEMKTVKIINDYEIKSAMASADAQMLFAVVSLPQAGQQCIASYKKNEDGELKFSDLSLCSDGSKLLQLTSGLYGIWAFESQSGPQPGSTIYRYDNGRFLKSRSTDNIIQKAAMTQNAEFFVTIDPKAMSGANYPRLKLFVTTAAEKMEQPKRLGGAAMLNPPIYSLAMSSSRSYPWAIAYSTSNKLGHPSLNVLTFDGIKGKELPKLFAKLAYANKDAINTKISAIKFSPHGEGDVVFVNEGLGKIWHVNLDFDVEEVKGRFDARYLGTLAKEELPASNPVIAFGPTSEVLVAANSNLFMFTKDEGGEYSLKERFDLDGEFLEGENLVSIISLPLHHDPVIKESFTLVGSRGTLLSGSFNLAEPQEPQPEHAAPAPKPAVEKPARQVREVREIDSSGRVKIKRVIIERTPKKQT